MSAERSLVTGAAGFVGASLVRRLLADGDHVAAVVRPGGESWRLEDVLDDVELLEADVADAEALSAAVSAAAAARVFHLAAHGSYSWQVEATRIRATNIGGLENLLAAIERVGCEAIVNVGSSSEYGRQDHAPAESEIPSPSGDYAVAKLEATRICEAAAERGGIPVVTTRLYSVYGRFEDPRRLVPTLAARGLRGELPALVDPAIGRDFVWVDDAVAALIAAAARAPSAPGELYNVGTGQQSTVGELVELARRILEIEAEPHWGSMEARSWDTDVWVADARKARAELGWTPTVSLEQGFRATVDWLRESPSLWPRYGLA